MHRIVVANWVHEEVLAFLQQHGVVDANLSREPWPSDVLLERCASADALIAFMPEQIDDDFLAACPKLRIVAGALKGYDNFDVEACTRRGVWMTVVPDLLTAPTAELCVGLMIALGRNLLAGDRHIREGGFSGWRPRFYGRSIDDSVVGIWGGGAIGKAIAKRLSGFSCRKIYHDAAALSSGEEANLQLEFVPLHDLQAQSDFLILALPLTPATAGLIDADFLNGMKPESYLVNPARGSLVDEAAVADALGSGLLAGYGADVFEFEDWARADRPDSIEPRLLRASNTVLTPHLGSAVDAVRREIAFEAARNVVQSLRGDRPSGAVNDPTASRVSC